MWAKNGRIGLLRELIANKEGGKEARTKERNKERKKQGVLLIADLKTRIDAFGFARDHGDDDGLLDTDAHYGVVQKIKNNISTSSISAAAKEGGRTPVTSLL